MKLRSYARKPFCDASENKNNSLPMTILDSLSLTVSSKVVFLDTSKNLHILLQLTRKSCPFQVKDKTCILYVWSNFSYNTCLRRSLFFDWWYRGKHICSARLDTWLLSLNICYSIWNSVIVSLSNVSTVADEVCFESLGSDPTPTPFCRQSCALFIASIGFKAKWEKSDPNVIFM